MAKAGLYSNIAAKRQRIEDGSGEKMKKAGAKGAPSASDFRQAAKTVKKKVKKYWPKTKLTFYPAARFTAARLTRLVMS